MYITRINLFLFYTFPHLHHWQRHLDFPMGLCGSHRPVGFYCALLIRPLRVLRARDDIVRHTHICHPADECGVGIPMGLGGHSGLCDDGDDLPICVVPCCFLLLPRSRDATCFGTFRRFPFYYGSQIRQYVLGDSCSYSLSDRGVARAGSSTWRVYIIRGPTTCGPGCSNRAWGSTTCGPGCSSRVWASARASCSSRAGCSRGWCRHSDWCHGVIPSGRRRMWSRGWRNRSGRYGGWWS